MKTILQPLTLLAATISTLCSIGFAEPTPVVLDNNAGAVIVSPNPYRSDIHADTSISFEHLPSPATIQIFTISGREVQSLSGSTGTASWNRTNRNGEKVASGVYFYIVKDGRGNITHGKLAIIN